MMGEIAITNLNNRTAPIPQLASRQGSLASLLIQALEHIDVMGCPRHTSNL